MFSSDPIRLSTSLPETSIVDVSLFDTSFEQQLEESDAQMSTSYASGDQSVHGALLSRYAITDSVSVHEYPDIIGLKKNMFYISHKHLESKSNEDKSKSNSFEASYIAKMCEYLYQARGYKASSITVLTMYLGQQIEVRKHLMALGLIVKPPQPLDKSVRVCTVDNYQGKLSSANHSAPFFAKFLHVFSFAAFEGEEN